MVASVVVGCFPAFGMLACTVVGLHVTVPDNVAGALQHFAAGLLLSAVGCELLPTLLDATGIRENSFATVGFFSGMAALIVLGHLLPEHDDDDHDHGDHDAGGGKGRDEPPVLAEGLSKKRSLRRSVSKRGVAKAIQGAAMAAVDTIPEDSDHETPVGEGDRLLGRTGSSASSLGVADRGLPLSFLAAVLVDSFMDGFLLGITGVAGPGAAIIMAGSLTVEMSFVGLTLAAACRGLPWSKSIPAAASGPLILVGGALAGGLVSDVVADDPALLAGALGFGTSALLFMVAEELLLEAHEKAGGAHVWWVDLQLYTGFYWGILSTKFLPE